METVRGQVESVRVLRESWGRVVVLHGSDRERAIVMGTVLGLREGETVEAEGVWSTHPQYGRQFKARRIDLVAPSDAAGAIAWMCARLPNVGRKIATQIAERWEMPELWNVLGAELEPGKRSPLEVFAGITNARAHAIHAAYREHRAERDLMVQLKGWGLTEGQCASVVKAYGADAPTKLREDPYALIDELRGWGWKRADRLALHMGLPSDHPGRIRACIEWMLGEAEAAGHVFVPAGKLVAMVGRELGVKESAVRREANALLDAERVVLRPRAGAAPAAYVARLEHAEAGVAGSVLRLLGAEAGEQAA